MKKRVLLISYGDYDYDGRLRCLIDVFSQIGTIYCFTRGKTSYNKSSKVYNQSYIRFVFSAIKFAKAVGKIDCLVLDNRKATIPGLIIKKILHPSKVIQDCRELYILTEVKHLTGKIGCLFEEYMVKRADVVICANKERAHIMKRIYKLDMLPIVYENLRQLQYESNETKKKAEEKLSQYIKEGEIRIISTSGCSVQRTNDVLVRNLDKVEKPCRLFLVGDSSPEDIATIKKIIKDKKLNNVEIVGRLNQSELKWLISKSHIGIVNYGQYDANNKYCASGKMYEYLYEGIPVLTTTNPPLLNICKKYAVGISDDQYADAINEIIANYDYYIFNVQAFINRFSIGSNNHMLVSKIREIINQADFK